MLCLFGSCCHRSVPVVAAVAVIFVVAAVVFAAVAAAVSGYTVFGSGIGLVRLLQQLQTFPAITSQLSGSEAEGPLASY